MSARDFHTEWFQNPKWWFSQTPDNIDSYLTSKYEHLLFDDTINEFQLVLIHDQLARHVYRSQPGRIAHHLRMALDIVTPQNLLRILPTLTEAEKVFFMMPIRHSGDYDRIKVVLGYTFLFLATAPSDCARNVLKRFIKATCNDLIRYQPSPTRPNCPPSELDQFAKILEMHPEPKASMPIKLDHKPVNPVISLSGGVDSMVLSYLLRTTYPDLPIKAIMINYMNRPECNSEVAFVKMWCDVMSIELYVQHIPEMNRKLCIIENMRETYESYTKQVRFKAYRSFGSDATILLGHNKDDIMENIFSNVMDKNHFENLAGMVIEDTIDGISFLRPLLQVRKSRIFDYAHFHNISYLKNTTPTWSRRAKMRAMFTEYSSVFSESGMDYLSNALKFYSRHLSASLSQVVSATKSGNTYTFHETDLSKDEIYWKTYFGLMDFKVSTKSIRFFLERLVKWVETDDCNQTFVMSSQFSIVMRKRDHMISMDILYKSAALQ